MYKSYAELGNKPEENVDLYQVPELQSLDDKQKLIQNNRIACVYIWGDFCGPCKVIAPSYALLAQKFQKLGIPMVKQEYDKVKEPGVQGVPFFQIFFEGKIVDSVIGGDLERVEKSLNNLLSNQPQTSYHNRSSIRNFKPQQGQKPTRSSISGVSYYN
jgi:thioredoxin 1